MRRKATRPMFWLRCLVVAVAFAGAALLGTGCSSSNRSTPAAPPAPTASTSTASPTTGTVSTSTTTSSAPTSGSVASQLATIQEDVSGAGSAAFQANTDLSAAAAAQAQPDNG